MVFRAVLLLAGILCTCGSARAGFDYVVQFDPAFAGPLDPSDVVTLDLVLIEGVNSGSSTTFDSQNLLAAQFRIDIGDSGIATITDFTSGLGTAPELNIDPGGSFVEFSLADTSGTGISSGATDRFVVGTVEVTAIADGVTFLEASSIASGGSFVAEEFATLGGGAGQAVDLDAITAPSSVTFNSATISVPEPGSLGLIGLVGAVAAFRRKRAA